MEDTKNTIELESKLMPVEKEVGGRNLYISLLGNYPETEETRLLLTPEAVGLLTSGGIKVLVEEGAGIDISFSDEAYVEYGAKIVSRDEALKCSTVFSYTPLKAEDLRKMNDGSTILCMMNDILFGKDVIKTLLDKKITLACLDNMYSHNDEPVFANIIDEIDGRAAIMYAQEHLSFLGGGKGVLLAGVAGINPCEVLIIGEGNDVCSAAIAAIDAGASVTLLNNDISALQTASQYCGRHLTTLAIHPRVLYNKVKTADVIILGTTTRPFEFPKKLVVAMKESAYVLDFHECHPSVSVPRTVAMALSNVLVNFIEEIAIKDGFDSMVAMTSGVQSGVVTFGGKLVDKLVGSYLSMPSVDIEVMLAGRTSN
ncbi:MAG: hypothetical protein NC097_07810 [Clostridium sp.]|nr:hypothetical protein [Prevotella sp.]MCM1429684.1 hypothetical protein [Clostridium sp.]MCM1476161.1 hypothetical protein [Muribaculaceae bacterium]